MKKQLSLRRVVGSVAAAVLAAAAVWLLCRWVGYDLQLRVGNQPVYEIVNDDYTQVIDLPEEGFDQAIPLQAGESLYGVRLRFSTHGQLYRAGMVMVDLCDAAGNELRQAAGNYANVFDDNFTGFSFGAPYTAEQAETVYLHIYNAVEWEGPLGLWASETTVKDLPLTADGKSQNATLALQYMTDYSGSWPTRLANELAPLLAGGAFAAVLLAGLQLPLAVTVAVAGLLCGLAFVRVTPARSPPMNTPTWPPPMSLPAAWVVNSPPMPTAICWSASVTRPTLAPAPARSAFSPTRPRRWPSNRSRAAPMN